MENWMVPIATHKREKINPIAKSEKTKDIRDNIKNYKKMNQI